METIYEVFDVATNAAINRIVLENPAAFTPPTGKAIRPFSPPPAPETPAARPMPLTPLAFLRRFTAEERIAIRNCPYPIIQDFLFLVMNAQDIRTDDPDTVAGVHYLAQQGLIHTSRVADVLR